MFSNLSKGIEQQLSLFLYRRYISKYETVGDTMLIKNFA